MTIAVLNLVFPKSIIVAGVTGSWSRKNSRTSNQGGYASANSINDNTLHSWQIGTAPLNLAQAQQFRGVAEATDFGVYGMLLEDPTNSSVTADNSALMGYMAGVESGTVGYGNGGPTYGFRQLFTYGSFTRAQARTRLNGTPVVTRAGAPVTVGASAGNISISAGPSYVTFVADASRSVSSVTVGATTQVTLSSAIAGLAIGGKLWLDTLSGADAGLLNNLSHTITNISGGGLNVYTLSTNTAGKTITAGSGQGRKYPQPTEKLAWAGNFYFPVQFREDSIEWDLVIAGPMAGRYVSIPSTYLDEVREA